MAAAARKLTPLKTMSRALVKAVAQLEPDVAVARLAKHHASEPPGLRRRALLAARIELIRKAMEAPPKPVIEVREPEPVVEPPPPVVIVPPKPLSKGVVTSINLDDVAKMLMAAPAEEPPPAPEPEATSGAVAISDVAAAFAAMDWGDTAEQVDLSAEGEAALWADLAGQGAGATAIAAPEAMVETGSPKAGQIDLAAAFMEMDGPAEAPAPLDLAAQFAAFEEAEPVVEAETVAERPALPSGMDAAFALLGDLDGPETAARVAVEAPAGGIDLSAQFAALEEGPSDMDAAFAMLGALPDAETVPEDQDAAPVVAEEDGLGDQPGDSLDFAKGDMPTVDQPPEAGPDLPMLDETGEELTALQKAMRQLELRRAATEG